MEEIGDDEWMTGKTLNWVMFLGLGLGVSLICGCQPVDCDLAVEVVSIVPSDPVVGDGVVFTFRVINKGPMIQPKESFEVDLQVDGVKTNVDRRGNPSSRSVDEYVEYSIGPGHAHFEATKPGRVSYELSVTPGWRVRDSDPGNNVIRGSFEVKATR